MKRDSRSAAVRSATTLLLIWTTLAVAAPVEGSRRVGPQEGKIDGPLLAAMSDSARIPVLILGSHQLLPPPRGFPDYVGAHAGDRRREARPRVIGSLRAIADEEQQAILRVLPQDASPTSFWLVNAVVADLTAPEIRSVAGLPSVARVYLADRGLTRTTERASIPVVSSGPATPLDTTGRVVSWDLRLLHAPDAWALGATGAGVTVAVYDGGVDYRLPDLRGHVWRNPGEVPNNGLDDDANGLVDDVHGFDFATGSPDVLGLDAPRPHGTWVAGILAGDGTGGTITGVAPQARLMPVVANGIGGALLAIQYALEEDADVMNMSFSIPGLGNLRGVWRLAAEQAVAAGLVMVSGAGNFRQTEPVPVQLRIPESIPAVLAVGGVDSTFTLVRFSSGGPVSWSDVHFYEDYPALVKPDVAAFFGPGYPLLDAAGGGYLDNRNRLGNSFSSPHVAGVAALMLSVAPDLPAWRVKEIIEETARGDGQKNNDVGWGVVDAVAAVRAALRER